MTRGDTLAQVVLALADGATCLSDLAALRAQPDVFGPMGSDATLWLTPALVDACGSATTRAAGRSVLDRSRANSPRPSFRTPAIAYPLR
jgi:hypothetical protein